MIRLDDLESSTLVLVGFGTEGQGSYLFLRSRFPGKRIGIADRRHLSQIAMPAEIAAAVAQDHDLEMHCGDDYLSCLPRYRAALKSPGIPPSLPELVAYRAAGGSVTSHLELFFSIAGPQPILGVTGTKGKSTTASLLHHLLQDAGIEAVLAANIGAPPLQSLPADGTDRRQWVVECSSYQLAELHSSPRIAVLLGVVPEHLGVHDPSLAYAHHPDFASYVAAKETITRYQGPDDILVFNADNEVAAQIAARSRARRFPVSQRDKTDCGAYMDNGHLLYANQGVVEEIADVASIPLLGAFNQINVLAAVTAARLAGASGAVMRRSIASFRGLPHRLEFAGEVAGVSFYDDSISTVPDATIRALEALGERVSTVILGGHDRGADFSALARTLMQRHLRHLLLFSPSGPRLWRAVEQQCGAAEACPEPHFVADMQTAVDLAMRHARPGEICLLSPASASYGTFKNFEQRGRAFREAIARAAASAQMAPASQPQTPREENASTRLPGR